LRLSIFIGRDARYTANETDLAQGLVEVEEVHHIGKRFSYLVLDQILQLVFDELCDVRLKEIDELAREVLYVDQEVCDFHFGVSGIERRDDS